MLSFFLCLSVSFSFLVFFKYIYFVLLFLLINPSRSDACKEGKTSMVSGEERSRG